MLGFGVGHMRDTKTKGGWSFSFFSLLYLVGIRCDLFQSIFNLIWSYHTGIWIWGTPIDLEIDGVKTSVFYIDTEGFESIGKSNVYDDR